MNAMQRRAGAGVLALVILAAAGCGGAPRDGRANGTAATPRVEALSLFGRPLFTPQPAAAALPRLVDDLAEARAAYELDPDDADAIIWLGRRLAYLGRFRDAIDVFTEGVGKHPDDPRMYRHRGHRFITTREFRRALADLEHAAALVDGSPDEIEPDGAPNRHGIPVSTLHTNIWYHLALAHYLQHDFERAAEAWQRTLDLAPNDDMVVAASDWLYLSLRRLGRRARADSLLERITVDMTILENDAYHRRLLMYRGLLPADELMPADTEDPVQLATYGYGIAAWHLVNGDRHTAETLFRRILQGGNWAAFGFIAAEAEVAPRRR